MGETGTKFSRQLAGRNSAEQILEEAQRAFWVMAGLMALIWLLQLINAMDNYQLDAEYALRARDIGHLPGIVASPFLHASWNHIEGNSGALFVFGFLAAFRGVRKFLGVTLLIIVISGLAAWLLTSPSETIVVGASGLIFGYFGYVLVRGFFDLNIIDIVVAVVLALSYAYPMYQVLKPGTPGISWQAHAGGLVAGIIGGWMFRERRSPAVDAAGGPATKVTKAGQTGQVATIDSSRAQLHKELDDLGL